MVSIVIVARNLQDRKLWKCQDSIAAQTYQDIEIIVVSEGNIRDARKIGVGKAKGEYICFVDSDQILPPSLINICVTTCELGYGGVTWVERALNPSTFCEKIIDYDKKLFHSEGDDDPLYGAAEPRFFHSKFVKKLDWSRLPPVTFELSAINKQINDMGANIFFLYDDNGFVTVHHHEPKTFRELFRKFFRYGYYYIPSLKYNRELVLNHSKPRRVYFSRRALSQPLLYVGLWFHYFIKATAALGGALWYLVRH